MVKKRTLNKRKFGFNKRGSMFDIIYLTVGFFVLVLMTFIIHKIWNEMYPQLRDETWVSSTSTGNETLQSVQTTFNGFNFILLFVFFGMILAIIILATQIQVHPAFYFIGLLVLMIAITLGAMFSNAFAEITDEADFANQTVTFNYSKHVLDNYPKYLAVAGFLAIIVIYAKLRRGRE